MVHICLHRNRQWRLIFILREGIKIWRAAIPSSGARVYERVVVTPREILPVKAAWLISTRALFLTVYN